MSVDMAHKRRDLLNAFFILTFAFTWGIAGLLVLFPSTVEALFGELSTFHPLFLLAVAGPTLVATLLTFVSEGWPGLRRLYAGLIQWRFGIRWYALLFVGIPLLGYLAARISGPEAGYELGTPALVVAALFNLLITGALGEELGWRGFALPRLLKRYSPLVASLVLGAIWGVWHLPSFVMSGLPQAGLSIPIFLFAGMCLAILATWIYQHTNGSLLSVVIFHYMINFSLNFLGTPLAAMTVVAAVGAVLVVVLDRSMRWLGENSVLVWKSKSIKINNA